MASIRFNCVIKGKRTSTSLNEHLVRHYATAMKFFENNHYPTYHTDRTSKGYLQGIEGAKKIVQDFINSKSNWDSTDEIEHIMFKNILYTKPKTN